MVSRMHVEAVQLLVSLVLAFLPTSLHFPMPMHTMIDSVDRLVNYYADNYKEMNVDGIFGLRALEGQLLMIHEEYEQGKRLRLDRTTADHIKELSTKASGVGNMAIPHLQNLDPEYFSNFKYIVARPWKMRHHYRKADLSIAGRQNNRRRGGDQLTEEKSDRCMAGLLGTGDAKQQCTVDDECWRLMSAPGKASYYLTHQLLFFVLGEQLGCTDELDALARKHNIAGGVQELEHRFCSTMLGEVEAVVRRGLKPSEQDIFMEQIFTCGMMGYYEFMRKPWLDMILTWQDASGCFRSADGEDGSDTGEDDEAANRVIRKQDKQMQGGLFPPPKRRLLEEKALRDGCLSHKTAVGAGALAVFLHYLVNPYLPGDTGRKGISTQGPFEVGEQGQLLLLMLVGAAVLVFFARMFARRRFRRMLKI
ncbi:UPF0764 protein C16orf89 homolog [Branchiostoma floridae]|uniref:UPF0764 protein C16orf89 homolog n=1 Tax=Branchiostoma floridae TaxID=7739 RepID=C3Y0J1_BRAFL|nr:UPF0764 protein C16orf89 homolog [Branchiostoma floridae]|eukprot:XP_002610254.1 hypothetical protein BRAFLDRAFT_126823 [Branchiostoma floridae]